MPAPRTIATARAAVLATFPGATLDKHMRRHGRGGRPFVVYQIMEDPETHDGMIAHALTERNAWIRSALVAGLPFCGRCNERHAAGAHVPYPGEFCGLDAVGDHL